MNIAENLYVAIDYRLTLASGEEIDSSPAGEPLGFVTGSGQIIPGLEKALFGMKTGESSKITVEPEEAYGPLNQELVQEISRDQFPADENLEPGMTFQAQGPQGPIMITVTEVKDDGTVTIDMNHPLAGKQLIFDIKVVEVRKPNNEELAQLAGGCGCGCGSGEQNDSSCGCGTGDQKSCGSGCDCS